jgi:hypothetical protein
MPPAAAPQHNAGKPGLSVEMLHQKRTDTMSSATALKIAGPKSTAPSVFDQSVAGLKQGVDAATAAHAAVSKAGDAVNAFATFNQGSLEAFTQANGILAAGLQDLFRQMLASSQAAFHEAQSGIDALMAAKTVEERLEMQASLARAATARAIADSGHFAQAGFDLAQKASVPLTAQATLAAKTFSLLKI